MDVFVSLPTFHQQGGWVILCQCQAENSAASPHARLCQLEMCLEWHKESNAVFCGRQAGYHRLILPTLTAEALCSLTNVSSLHLSIRVHLSFSLRKMTYCVLTICPLRLTLALSL